MELVKHELNKVFLNKSLCALIIIFAIFTGVLSITQLNYKKIDHNAVMTTLKEYEGTLTNNKISKAESEFDILFNKRSSLTAEEVFKLNIYSKIRRINNAYYTNLKTIEEAKTNMENSSGYTHRNNVLTYNMTKQSLNYKFYYTGGWDYIIGYVNSPGAIIIAFLILVGLSSMFSGEYSTKMDSIILSTKYGKTKLIRAKVSASMIYVLLIDILFLIINFFGNIVVFGFQGWNAPMQVLENYMISPYRFTVLQYFFLLLVINIVACTAFGLFVVLISSLCKTQVLTFFLGSMFFIIPLIVDNIVALKSTLAKLVTLFSFTWFMQVEKLFNYLKIYSVLDKPVLYPVIVCIILILLIPLSIILIDKGFKKHTVEF